MTPENNAPETTAAAAPATPVKPAPAPDPFWHSLGQHAAVIAVEVGEQVALAFLSGFLSKKLGTSVSINVPPAGN